MPIRRPCFPATTRSESASAWPWESTTPGMAPLVSRVTLTLSVLNAAHEVVFLISGEDKADAVARAFGDAPDPSAPASLVRPEPGTLTLLLDPAAAKGLEAARA